MRFSDLVACTESGVSASFTLFLTHRSISGDWALGTFNIRFTKGGFQNKAHKIRLIKGSPTGINEPMNEFMIEDSMELVSPKL